MIVYVRKIDSTVPTHYSTGRDEEEGMMHRSLDAFRAEHPAIMRSERGWPAMPARAKKREIVQV